MFMTGMEYELHCYRLAVIPKHIVSGLFFLSQEKRCDRVDLKSRLFGKADLYVCRTEPLWVNSLAVTS